MLHCMQPSIAPTFIITVRQDKSQDPLYTTNYTCKFNRTVRQGKSGVTVTLP